MGLFLRGRLCKLFFCNGLSSIRILARQLFDPCDGMRQIATRNAGAMCQKVFQWIRVEDIGHLLHIQPNFSSFGLPLPLQNLGSKAMENLRGRMILHAEKVKELEKMEAALAGVFSQETQAGREKFAALVQEVIKPAFNEFKTALRELGRDAVIITNLTHHPVQSIGLTLLDRYLSFGAGKTLKLVNPKDDISKGPNTKFYEVYRSEDLIYIRQRVDPQVAPISTQLTYGDITPKFLENELASFFERAYPTKS